MIKKLQRHIFWSIELTTTAILFVILCVYNYSFISFSLEDEAYELNYCAKAIRTDDSQLGPYLNKSTDALAKAYVELDDQDSALADVLFSIVNGDISIIRLDSSGNISSITGKISDSEPLNHIIGELSDANKSKGTVSSYLYSIVKKDSEKYIVLLDRSSWTSATVRQLLLSLVLFAAAAVLLGLMAYALSRRISKPVENALERQSRFIADASHELKTPVSIINANISILEREYGESKWMNYISNEGRRMAELINQLLLLCRVDYESSSGDSLQRESMERIELEELLTEAYLPFDSLAYEKGAVINTSFSGVHSLNGSRSDIKSIITILLDNATQHVNSGGEIMISVSEATVRPCILKRPHALEVCISNTGTAIPEKDLPNIFDRFYKANTEPGGNNFGLGLSIAKSIASKNNYELTAASNEKSTQFRLIIRE